MQKRKLKGLAPQVLINQEKIETAIVRVLAEHRLTMADAMMILNSVIKSLAYNAVVEIPFVPEQGVNAQEALCKNAQKNWLSS